MTNNIQIETPEYKNIVAHDETRALQIVFGDRPNYVVGYGRKDALGLSDSVIIKDGVFVALAEVRCRYHCTHDTLVKTWKNEWLFTFSKLKRLARIAGELRVAAYGLMYIKDSNMVLVEKLADREGRIVCTYHVEPTETKLYLTSDETGVRDNAYILMDKARIYHDARIHTPTDR